jgi:uncharacterized protein (DUF1778 family)
MSKLVTLRLSDEEYNKIFQSAKIENRSIPNFIITKTLQEIDDSIFTDPVETDQILSDRKLIKKLQTGHGQAQQKKGRLVG